MFVAEIFYRMVSRRMGLSVIILILLMTFSASLYSACNSEFEKWCLLVYCDTDSERSRDVDSIGLYVLNELEEGLEKNDIDILFLWDRASGNDAVYQVVADHTPLIRSKIIKKFKEINSGSSDTLKDFIIQGKELYPNRRYMLVIFNHGFSWRGCCSDSHADEIEDIHIQKWNEYMSLHELHRGLDESGGVDILGFCSCMMASIEVMYELRNDTKVIIASEGLSGAMYWPWKKLVEVLSRSSSDNLTNLSEKIIDAFSVYNRNTRFVHRILSLLLGIYSYPREFYILAYVYPPHFTISAVGTEGIASLAKDIDKLSICFTNNIEEYRKTITRARSRVEDFPVPLSVNELFGDQIDIVHFCEIMSKMVNNQTIQYDLKRIKDKVSYLVIAEYHERGHPKANGLSIYFPPRHLKNVRFDWQFKKIGLKFSLDVYSRSVEFCEDTNWDDFLKTYLWGSG